MFTQLIHLLMCITVLVCPAMGGACCGFAGSSAATIEECESHCCCDTEHEESPVAPGCPEPCQDCFCAGALPPGFGASVELAGAVDVLGVAPISDLVAATSTQRLEFALRDESPPHGRALLTSYCRFLL
ncbi:hypothetical protein [Rubinisphaera italica]|uniref:Secreted protein n=1 Tax=Rubinisphaera italica TaxID=2527969 RepID=A0A5C5XQL5_9PLAN|nr:hypothetical protein [Rubinisphaera italica]TWT64365.1 hypothetical protein Pan54_51270 [Rubinisphaera italica]